MDANPHSIHTNDRLKRRFLSHQRQSTVCMFSIKESDDTNSKQMYRHNNVRVLQRIWAMKSIKKYRTFSQKELLRIDVFNQCFV
jgi:hypothetical protein